MQNTSADTDILHCNIIIMLRSIGMHLDPLPYVNWKLSEHHISKAEASHLAAVHSLTKVHF